MRKRMIQILIFVFIDVLGFSLILPLLPYYAEEFGANATLIGFLAASNAVTQLIGAPIIGRLSDRYGRRPLLIVSILGTVASFLLLGFADSLWMLFLSRALDGLLGGNVSLARAYITDITGEEERASSMGKIGATFGLGFIFGPALGGVLSYGGNYARPAFIAAGLSLLNLIGVILWLPESLPPGERGEESTEGRRWFKLSGLREALGRPCVGPLLIIRLVSAVAFTMFHTIFSTYALYRFDLQSQSTSYLLTYVGALVVIIQGWGIGKLTERFNERAIAFAGVALLPLGMLGWALAPRVWVLLIVLAPLSLASGILNTVISSLLSKVAHREETGGVLGIAASMGSLARVISPVAGGTLIDQLGTWAPGVLGAVIMVLLLPYAYRRLFAIPEPPKPGCQPVGEARPAQV
jgi:DHA1 family tetracycline resistance protein-like MFS transporter